MSKRERECLRVLDRVKRGEVSEGGVGDIEDELPTMPKKVQAIQREGR
jgi:hypothetical protein